MYTFSKKSLDRLMECHPDLQTVAKEAIKESPYDFGITWGHRSPALQNKLYQQGRTDKTKPIVTHVDGYIKKSKHNYTPSLAFDILIYVNGEHTWNPKFYLEVGTHIMEVAEDLFEREMITNRISWGGFWHKFKDWPHFFI